MIPRSLLEWNELHELASTRADGYERGLMQGIFDDAYLIDTIELLFSAPDPLTPEVLEPIEKFLSVVASGAIQTKTLELCFKARSETQRASVCTVFITIANMHIWGKLVQLGDSEHETLQRTGAAVVTNLIEGGFPTETEAREMLTHFRSSKDAHVQELLGIADKELLNYRKTTPVP